jgi:hypothetical protein
MVLAVGILIVAGLPVLVGGVLGHIGARRFGPLRAFAALLVALSLAALTAHVFFPSTLGTPELLTSLVATGVGAGSVRLRALATAPRTLTNSEENPVGALLKLSHRLADHLGVPRNRTFARPK